MLQTPPIFNWVGHVFSRSDDTVRSLENLARRPVGRSLRSTYRLCTELAYREIDIIEAESQIEKRLKGYSQDAAREIIPEFFEELTRRQFDTVPDYKGDKFPFPIGRAPDNSMLAIPVSPTFVAFEQGRLLPVFVLGWRNAKFKYDRLRLISAVIHRSILTWQEFHGSDGLIMTFGRNKWSNEREAKSWRTSQYNDMSEEELQSSIDRYSSALCEVINRIKND